MPFIDMGEDFGKTAEVPMAVEGEYDLVCGDVGHNTDNGKNTLSIQMKFEDGNYAPFLHFIALPQTEKDKAKDQDKGNTPGTTSKTKMLFAKRFCNAFGVEFTETGFDTKDIPGSRARIGISQSPADDQGRIFQNLRLPRLPDEEAKAA